MCNLEFLSSWLCIKSSLVVMAAFPSISVDEVNSLFVFGEWLMWFWLVCVLLFLLLLKNSTWGEGESIGYGN